MRNLLLLMHLPDCVLGLKLSTKGTSCDSWEVFDPGSNGAEGAQTFARLCPVTDFSHLKINWPKCSCVLCVRVNMLRSTVIYVVSAVNKFSLQACYKTNTT